MVFSTHRRERIRSTNAMRFRRRRFAIELLEDRRLLAVVTWDGGAGTLNWTDANNWDTNVIPATVDSVVIPDLVGTPTILYGSGTRTVASIQTAETLSVTGGSLSINGNLSGVGSLVIAGGAVAFGGTNWANTSSLVLNSGTLNLGGSCTQSGVGTFSRSGGTVNLVGTITGNLTLDAVTGAWSFGGGGRMVNGLLKSSSIVVQNGNFTLDHVTIDATTTFQTAASVFITTVQNGLTIDGQLLVGGSSDYATIRLTGLQTIDGSGSVLFGGFVSSGGSYNSIVTANATITFGPSLKLRGKYVHFDGSGVANYVLQGLTQPDVASGGFYFSPSVSSLRNEGIINPINGTSVTFAGSALTNVGTVTVSSTNAVSLIGTGIFSNTGSIIATGGGLDLGGTWTNTGTISVTNTAVTLGGSFTQFGMGAASPAVGQGTFTRSGGMVNLVGTITGN